MSVGVNRRRGRGVRTEDEGLLSNGQICWQTELFRQASPIVRSCDSQLSSLCPRNHLLRRPGAAAAAVGVLVCVWFPMDVGSTPAWSTTLFLGNLQRNGVHLIHISSNCQHSGYLYTLLLLSHIKKGNPLDSNYNNWLWAKILQRFCSEWMNQTPVIPLIAWWGQKRTRLQVSKWKTFKIQRMRKNML